MEIEAINISTIPSLTITLLKFKKMYTKAVINNPSIGPLLPLDKAKINSTDIIKYL